MNIQDILKMKTGGRWLISSNSKEKIFCRESFTDEHKEIEKMVFKFTKDRIYPNVQQLDTFDQELSQTLLKEMGSLGLLGIDTPEKYGGTELDKRTAIIVAEAVGHGGSASFGCTFGVQTGIGTLGIVFFGSDKQKEKYLPGLITGEKIAAYGLTEPSAGSDALSAKTSAILSEDGKNYILNGEKQFISNGGWADTYTILAQIDGSKFSGFIVERDTEGFTIGPEEKKMGMKGSSTTSLKFTNAVIPIENLLSNIGDGASIAFSALNIGRYKLGASSVGGSKLAITESIKYAHERKQFGQNLAKFDSISGKITDSTIRTYLADTMLYRTVGMIQDAIDDLDPNDSNYYLKISEVTERFAVEASMVKVYGSETSSLIVDTCLQIFGGYGFIEDYPMAMPYRDDRINQIWEGTNEINRAIITGYMMKKVLMEEISLREYLKNTPQIEAQADDDHKLLINEIKALDASKLLSAHIFQEALCEYGQDLKHQQQLSEKLADIFIEIFTLESAILRIKQTFNSSEKSEMILIMTQIATYESMTKIRSLGEVCLRKVFPNPIPKKISEKINDLKSIMFLDTDIISLKQTLGEFILKQPTFPF
jgi:alkylation response protein AidB-like acyl-CoA dehydrogenase